jgi:hypothetical protein
MGRAHGDMSMANMVRHKKILWLYDWERASTTAPVMTDSVGWFLSFSVGKLHHKPSDCLREFREHFLPAISPQARLDLMLALAFRYASGIPESEFYIRNWRTLSPA